MRSNRVNMDTEWATESVRIKRVELCSSRKYPYPSSPPPPNTEGNGNSEGRGGSQKDAISDGVVGGVASQVFFRVSK